MIAIRDLFESHLTVSNLDRSVQFYRDVLELPLAHIVPERRVAFFWIGAPGKAMLGVWETGAGPQRMTHHLAFQVEIDDVLAAPNVLRQAGITHSILIVCQPMSPSFFAGCLRSPCTSTIRTGICWNFSRCSLTHPVPAWALSHGVHS